MGVGAGEIKELHAVSKGAKVVEVGGTTYVHLPTLALPDGRIVEALLCLTVSNGYSTRLFLSEPVPSKGSNWTVHTILDKAWHTWSWNGVPSDIRPIEVLASHLAALR